MKQKIASLCVILCLGWLSCEKPVTGVLNLFPGPGLVKGWSWDGMPRLISSDADSEILPKVDWLEAGQAAYYRGSRQDSSFMVTIVRLRDSLQVKLVQEYLTEKDVVTKSDSSVSWISENEALMVYEDYLIILRTANHSTTVMKGMNLASEAVRRKIAKREYGKTEGAGSL